MLINDNLTVSSIYQQIAQKKAQLANIDKEELLKSSFEKEDSVNLTNTKYDENDYKRVLSKFQNLDAQTRAHEQTHASLSTTRGAINYTYQMGPDGKLYATGGHVRLDTSIPKDPVAALAKLDELKKASSGPSELSSADASIARAANLNKMLILSKQQQGETNES
ncbi:hypothetical protein CPU12_09465 [Malaciobacter molluscorum LMG 25693]|uniref:SprA family protein n=1 Tax=Malaciobacter molluscorum LMG 25693 TaxID=870501 RepID=A0A2G1DGN3_9BACT|nr:putative metalloprotease CJM1_0395 family protein [Malaciobacter molluscorum]AXX92472.1 SprA family protein [Malaciobacter molluscorum LMG 25693]PHO17658.1 hypothetical protein CPU12_09465 [Malaciobacter molluscorum LMG 25693]RXJ93444.1 hypothetical protein CRV00_10975 [Malaciobacter molluscorum]